MWDPQQYGRFADERARPFADLLTRLTVPVPRRVADLGCGPGTLTASLHRLWPHAEVVGVDSSPEMIARAREHATDRLSFRLGDLRQVALDPPFDVVVSNAALQWVPDHGPVVERLAGAVPPGGALAVQVPGHAASPSHLLLAEVCADARWADRLAGLATAASNVLEPADYVALLAGAGLTPDVWETTYSHVLPGEDAVLEWMKGTALRPVLAALPEPERAAFLVEYGTRLRAAYPPAPYGTLFPFRRIFAVGTRA